MIIYMMGTHRGSPDGFRSIVYRECGYYDVPQSLGASFINNGWALEISDEDIRAGLNGVDPIIINQNLSAAESLMPLPNLSARGMPRPSTLVRLNENFIRMNEEAV